MDASTTTEVNVSNRISSVKSTEELRQVFGSRLLDSIRNAGLNQSELARRCGLTKDAISSYVRGRCLPKQATFDKICAELEVHKNDLLPRRYDTHTGNAAIKLVSVSATEFHLSINVLVSLEDAMAIIAQIPRAGQ